jgi:hypothetical protein
MSDKNQDFLSDTDAALLWKRAAELQAEAARAAESAPESAEDDAVEDALEPEGYALEHVRQAAVEAGISSEFIEEALVELGTERVLPPPPPGLADKLAKRWLGNPDDNLEASRIINASVETVLTSMEKILPAPPFKLLLKDQRGDPRSGGVLVFDIQGASFVAPEGWTGQTSWADLREIYASVRRIPGEPNKCELTVRAPVAWARRLNAAIGGAVTGVGTGVGLGFSVVAGELLTDAFLGPVGFTLAVIAMVFFIGMGVTVPTVGFRALYGVGMNKGRKALDSLVAAVAQDAQGGWGVSGPQGPELQALPAPESADS